MSKRGRKILKSITFKLIIDNKLAKPWLKKERDQQNNNNIHKTQHRKLKTHRETQEPET